MPSCSCSMRLFRIIVTSPAKSPLRESDANVRIALLRVTRQRILPVKRQATAAYRAPACGGTITSGKNRYVTQTRSFIEAKHQIHALHALPGRTFDQIVLDDQNDE